MLTLVVMGVAFSTFDNASELNDAVVQASDQSQNLRVGTNLLIRDLLQAGRNIPTGGISIPSGDAEDLHRPGPEGEDHTFDNTDQTTLMVITTGGGQGPEVAGETTDMITILLADPYLEDLTVAASTSMTTGAKLSADGSSMDLGDDDAWMAGDVVDGIAPIAVGDVFYFSRNGSGNTLQTVTRIEASIIYFDADDPFNFNQRDAEAGSITEIVGGSMDVRRVYLYTYWVEARADGIPRLMRATNFSTPTELAGTVEDLTIRYDLVDGTVNPTNIENLPFEEDDKTYTATQIRKVNVALAVRSETVSARTGDYVRNRVSTTVSIRNLAFVDRYVSEE
jgi:hypothetical protein